MLPDAWALSYRYAKGSGSRIQVEVSAMMWRFPPAPREEGNGAALGPHRWVCSLPLPLCPRLVDVFSYLLQRPLSVRVSPRPRPVALAACPPRLPVRAEHLQGLRGGHPLCAQAYQEAVQGLRGVTELRRADTHSGSGHASAQLSRKYPSPAQGAPNPACSQHSASLKGVERNIPLKRSGDPPKHHGSTFLQ